MIVDYSKIIITLVFYAGVFVGAVFGFWFSVLAYITGWALLFAYREAKRNKTLEEVIV